ncbi:hypothetical protein ASA_0540 [Aeromonas salmonicida subsp. salmonicida A449]|uniref:Uncharacterized protein n=1 Tax=Aeromonas salmonicida (strain A449) TaxID=382245 RepID=A4SII4_AERS4|nr:hypothetical protein ASA_0540 [Aeromonas salmonicida subsp. salmonicida A449]
MFVCCQRRGAELPLASRSCLFTAPLSSDTQRPACRAFFQPPSHIPHPLLAKMAAIGAFLALATCLPYRLLFMAELACFR